jgi:ERCC4-type nuclease
MFLKIDCREKDLIEQIQCLTTLQEIYHGVTFVVERLDIGDVIFYNDDNQPIIVIERKTIPDLLSSICDKRYEEQSYRLNEFDIPNHHIFYLIEGNASEQRLFSRVNKLTYYSTLFSIQYYKGFSLIKSECLAESAIIVCNMMNKLKKSTTRLPFYLKQKENNQEQKQKENNQEQKETEKKEETQKSQQYAHVVKKTKKENINIDNIDTIMLSQIPSVSVNIAIVIMNKFGSIQQLIQQYYKTEETERKNLFNHIYLENEKGTKRKISKTSIQNIQQYLLKLK